MRTSRRALITGLASCLVAPNIQAKAARLLRAEPLEGTPNFKVHELSFARSSRSKWQTRVYVPHGLTPDQQWPVAVLLHGYAQALVDERALAAWRAEYDVLKAYRQLQQASIAPTSALDVTRASQIQHELVDHPFTGMVLVTPVTPIPYFQKDLGHTLRAYTDWIHTDLLPEVAKIAPISTEPERIGLAGVSMGGLVGLELMWRFPERFGAYCGIQIALKRSQVHRYAWLLDKAFNDIDDGHGRPIRVVTATKDTYRWSNQAFYKALARKKLDVSLELREGAHTSRWMREAGSLESLLWLDRTLHGGTSGASSAS